MVRGERAAELELIQPHMAQKPVLRGEVGCACVAREVSVERGGMGERGCDLGRVGDGLSIRSRADWMEACSEKPSKESPHSRTGT